MRTLLRHADVITLDPERDDVCRDVDVAIEGERIAHIGEVPATFAPDETVDLSGHLLLPGLWNAHTHAAMTFTRSIGDDLPLDRWFNDKIWVAESGLTEDDVYWGAMLAAAEMIRSGTVGFADHYFHMGRVAEVVEQAGLKALLATCVFGQGSEVGSSLADSAAWAERTHGAAGGRIRTTLGPHSPYICPPTFLAEVARAAAASGLGVHIHLAESADQVAASRAAHGVTPVQHVASLGLLDGPAICAHCIHVDDEDIAILAGAGAAVVQCPKCHMKLGMGVTPVPDMLARGVRVALGTDGPGSNNNLDMREEAMLAALMQKLVRGDATALPGLEPLRLACTNGAHAMGFADSGVLREGAAADVIAVELSQPHLVPRHSIVGNLLYAANAADVAHVMVDGAWLMRDRVLLTLDEPEILRQAELRAPAMVARGTRRLRSYQS